VSGGSVDVQLKGEAATVRRRGAAEVAATDPSLAETGGLPRGPEKQQRRRVDRRYGQ
jgi:hypothetical protein